MTNNKILGLNKKQQNYILINVVLITISVLLVGNTVFDLLNYILGLININYAQQIVAFLLVLSADVLLLFFVFSSELQKANYGIVRYGIIMFGVYLLLDYFVFQNYLTTFSLLI
jgi:hypothetical protein